MRSKLKRINFFLTSIIAISFFVMITINGIRTYFNGQSKIERVNKTLVENIKNDLEVFISIERKKLTMASELLLNDQEVIKLFASREREMLSNHLFPIYNKRLRKEFAIKQFQFHLAPATSFLRLHKLAKYGDDLSSFRKTVVQANSDNKVISGLEVGRGGLGMRLVSPIKHEGNYIGTMEFGTSFRSMLELIAKKQNVTFAIGVYKDVFIAAGRFKNADSDLLKGNIVFYDYSNPETKIYLNKIEIKDEIGFTEEQDRDYAVISIPIKDYSDQEIGYVTFFKDETDIISVLLKDILAGVFVPLLLASLVLGIIVFSLNRKLIRPLNELVKYIEDLTKGNYSAKQPVAYFTILQKLSDSMVKLRDKISEQYQMLENLPNPIIRIDTNFNIEYLNIKAAEIVGLKRREIGGTKCYNHFKTEHCNTEKCAVAQAINRKEIVRSETIANPNNKSLSIMYTGTPIINNAGEVIGGLDAITDVTKMKNREIYLSRSTETILGAMERFAHGDLTAQVKAEKEGDDISKLFEGFNRSVNNIKEMIVQVKEAVSATASASIQISSSAEEMAAGAEEQSSQTSEVAAAMEEMSRTVIETAANATNSAEASKNASEKANEGAEKLKASKEGMQQIVEATDTVGTNISSLASKTDQIGEISQVIDDIAEQTNLLALNAAIEAARAGEQGRGFAVVADEVRKLAERTTKATKEIAETIKAIQVEAKDANSSMEEAGIAVKSGMELNDEVGVVLTDILESVDGVSQQINQVAAASEEQSATAEQVSSNIESINNVANESAAVVQQIATASEDLNRLTENLSELVEHFNVDDNNNYLSDNYSIDNNDNLLE